MDIDVDDMLRQLEEIKRELSKIPAPPKVQYSRFATAWPSAKPRTDDMREMVDKLGKKRVPAAFRVSYKGVLGKHVNSLVIHPDLMPPKKSA